MPEEHIKIERFRGISGVEEARDGGSLAERLASRRPVYVRNIDLWRGSGGGVLPGSSAAGTGNGKAFAAFGDGTKAVSIVPGTGAYRLSVLGGSITSATLTGTPPNPSSPAAFGDSARYGLGTGTQPRFITATIDEAATLQTHESGTSLEVTAVTDHTTSGGSHGPFQYLSRYFYAYSLVYDGNQYSPLKRFDTITVPVLGSVPGLSVLAGDGYDDVDIELTLGSGITSSSRITAILIFRAEHPVADAGEPLSLWNLVHEETTISSPVTFTDDLKIGIEFEALTSVPHTLESMDVRYSLCANAGGRNVVLGAQVTNKSPSAYAAQLFVSLEDRPDSFVWYRDSIPLAVVPQALVVFGGWVFAFCAGRTYRISAEARAVVDEWQGTGVLGPSAYVVGKDGLFFADARNVYFIRGDERVLSERDPTPIAGPILSLDDDTYASAWSYHNMTSGATNATCLYFAALDAYAVIIGQNGWLWRYKTDEWCAFTPVANGASGAVLTVTGGFMTPQGRPIVTNGTSFYELLVPGATSSSNQQRVWVGPRLHDGGRKLIFKRARVISGAAGAFNADEIAINTTVGTHTPSYVPWGQVQELQTRIVEGVFGWREDQGVWQTSALTSPLVRGMDLELVPLPVFA